MGKCCFKSYDTKVEVPKCEEEKIISSKESLIPFYSTSLKSLEKYVVAHSYDDKLNKSDIKKLLTDIGQSTEYLSDPDSIHFKFFEAFADENRLYCQRKIILSAVLTSYDSANNKASTIDKYYDFSNDHTLESDEIKILLEDIVDISVKLLPKIAVLNEMETERDGILNQEKYNKYTEYLLMSKEGFLELYLKNIMENNTSITFQAFQNKMNQPHLSVLLSAQMVRILLFTMSGKVKSY